MAQNPAPQILKDCKLIVGQYDFSGDMNALSLDYSAEELDDTRFGHDTKSNTGGLKTVSFQHEGMVNTGAGGVDEVFFNAVGTSNVPVMISPNVMNKNSLAYFFKAGFAKYNPGAKVGALLAFSVGGSAKKSPLVRGRVLHDTVIARTATGVSEAFQLGAIQSQQKLYSAVSVLAVTGLSPEMVLTLQSCASQDFISTPVTDRVTFTLNKITAYGWGEPVLPVVGDTWWRLSWAISGTTPSFQFIVPVGIQ